MQTVDQIGKSKKTTRLFPQSGTVRIAHVGREAQSLEGSLFGTLGAQSCGTSLLLLTVVLFYAFPQVAKFVLEKFSNHCPGFSGEFLHGKRGFSPGTFLAVLEALEGVGALVSGYYEDCLLHVDGQGPQG
jgi:hypothetical protein